MFFLESLVQDGSKVTFDCAKATIARGGFIELRDEFYFTAEVQNAIKLGLVKVRGTPPAATSAPAEATKPKRKFRSAAQTKLAFECIKDYVLPGHFIYIPEDKMHATEIQNALAWGMLVDPDAAPKAEPQKNIPITLDELTVSSTPKPKQGKAPPKLAAKRISSTKEAIEEGGSDDGLYRESKVFDPKDFKQHKKSHGGAAGSDESKIIDPAAAQTATTPPAQQKSQEEAVPSSIIETIVAPKDVKVAEAPKPAADKDDSSYRFLDIFEN
jgi:hypothetical protein